MTPEEAAKQLRSIQQMVQQSRAHRSRTGDIYVVWGVVALVGIAGQIGLDAMGSTSDWMVWPAVIPVGIAYSIWRGGQEADQMVTWASRVEARVWQLVMAAIAVVCVAGTVSGTLPLNVITPLITAIVGVAMGATAEIYQLRSLYLSSALFLGVSAVCFFVDWQLQLAGMGLALLLGYIGPGVLMMREARRDG